MRLARPCMLCLLLGSLVGCLNGQPVQSTSFFEKFRLCGSMPTLDTIQMDVAVLECPIGDKYFNQELWSQADDQVVALERRALIEDNGFRVAQVGGNTPTGLQERLASLRYCPDPRRFQSHAGRPTPIPLGAPLTECVYAVRVDGLSTDFSFNEARCQLVVVPSLAPNGRTRLVFTPQIPHGKSEQFYGPADDRSQWQIREDQPTEKYANLNWEVTLAANEYVIVGARLDRPGTLGHRFLIRPEETPPRQRFLAIRTSRLIPGVAYDAQSEPEPNQPEPASTLPLALQASWPTARGNSQ